MPNRNITLKRNNAGTTEELYPTTDWAQINNKPSTFTPTSHSHGNITNGGAITANATIASGDHLVIADNSASNALTTSSITFGTGTTTFLRNDGTWGTPAGTADTNNYLTGVSGSGDGTVTFTRNGLGNLTWDASHSHSEYAPLASPSFTGNVSMAGGLEISGDLEVVGNSIGFIDTNFDAKIEVSDANPNNTGAIFDFYGDGVSRNATLSAEQFDGNAATTTKLLTARNIALTGDVTGNANFDGSANISITTAVANDSHTHDGRYYTETESNANFLKRTSTSLLDVNAANGTQLYTGSTGNWTNRGPAGNNAGALLSLNTHSGNYYSQLWFDTANDQFYFRSANGGTGVTTSWQKVWHDGNDGAGSGLAADTLDGQHGSYYAPLASPSFTGTPTAPTPAAGDDDTSIATTAFVQDAIESLVNGASASFDTLKEIQDAMATDTELSNAIAGLTIGNGTQTISVGTGLDGGGSFTANQTGNSTVSISLDLSEFTDMTADVNGLADELILLDGGAERRKLISEIKLSQFNNDSGWTSNVGDITNVTANNGLTGGGSSGSVTISHADTSTQSSVNNSGNTFIQDITLDTYGHITGLTSATASTTDSTKLPLAGGTMTGDLTMDHDGTGTSADSHGVVFTGRAVSTDFTRELYMDSGANLKFGTDTIFHSGNDGSSSGLHADLLDGQQGSYYLDYNNFTNTPTIPTGDITGVTAGSGLSGGGTSGTVTISHADTSSQASVNNSGRTYIQDITLDTYGHITGITSATETVTNTNTVTSIRRDNTGTYRTGNINLVGGNNVTITETSAGVFSFAATDTNTVYTHPTHPGDDINLDTGALTGATVISDLDFNITSDTLGHITDANATYSTRNLTASDIGAAASSHNHSASEIVTGNFNTARLGSGTATSGYVLKSDGDGTASWQQDNNTTYSLGSFGVTATAAELNKMDGVTATTTELNYTDGVTSNIQTQLNSKLSTSAAAAAVSYTTSCPTSTNSTGMKVYVGSTDCSTKYTGWLYIVT